MQVQYNQGKLAAGALPSRSPNIATRMLYPILLATSCQLRCRQEIRVGVLPQRCWPACKSCWYPPCSRSLGMRSATLAVRVLDQCCRSRQLCESLLDSSTHAVAAECGARMPLDHDRRVVSGGKAGYPQQLTHNPCTLLMLYQGRRLLHRG
jgi:hypothetical protein